jgi:hypothetical protein
MSDEYGGSSLRGAISRWLLIAMAAFWVFVGTLYIGFRVDRWAYPNLQDRSGDAFLSFCVSVILAIFAARMVARLTRHSRDN